MSTCVSAPSKSLRLRGLDALRGMACLAIVLYHATDLTKHAVPAGLLQYPVRALQFAISQTYISVFLFFVISGFCIHLQWARARAAGEDPKIPFVAFWKRRIRRLYPPYMIALALYLLLSALTVGLDVTRFVVYDVVMHLLMLHNLDSHTVSSINGIFWTLAIEEQLYLAYFLLLFLRARWGWTITLIVCLLARAGWMVFSHLVWLKSGGFGLPVPEAAASHWFTWALGAMGVEAVYGVIKLPRWTRDLRVAAVVIIAASIISAYLPAISKDTPLHDLSWFLIHPAWGLGFFIVINRLAVAELIWNNQKRLPTLISIFATLGLFSYSIYLTHELMIMQSWRWINPARLQMTNVFLTVVPAVIIFAWVYFWFCEKPFMVRSKAAATTAAAGSTSLAYKLFKEGLPSRASLTTFRTRLNVRLRRNSHIPKSDAESTAGAVGPAARLSNAYSDSIAVADSKN
jgi:peptidoglycan/LPS O-acetylase OafA/YrhL